MKHNEIVAEVMALLTQMNNGVDGAIDDTIRMAEATGELPELATVILSLGFVWMESLAKEKGYTTEEYIQLFAAHYQNNA